ncbi:MAG: beta-glucosidase BglX [Cyclobacteriaceae bacterium]
MKFRYIAVLLVPFLIRCMGTSTTPQASEEALIEQKIDSLISIMKLSEKVGQTIMYNGTWEFTGPVPPDADNQKRAENIESGLVGAMLNVTSASATLEAQKMAVEGSRLGIPLIFGYDVIHGFRTMFPIPLAQSASWNPEVAKVSSEFAAREASASGIHWTFAPMMDISRDSRWGRIMESAGEDPYLTAIMSRAWVEGFQGDDLASTSTIAACAKHFAAYGFAEAGREYNTVDISGNVLHNVVLPPFKAAADAKVATVMNAFNELNGIPATGSSYLQRDLLKEQWDWDGMIVSDWGSIYELIPHGFARDSSDAALKALFAGCDMDMASFVYENELEKLVTENKLDVALLDDAVRRVLRLKFRLGLFEDPYRYSSVEREKTEAKAAKNLEMSREVARQTMVLLKNNDDLLPLSKSAKSIAVIGQLANSKDVPLGSWRARAIPNSGISLLEGIQDAVSVTTSVKFAQGYTLTEGDRTFVNELTIASGENRELFKEAIALAKKSEYVVMAIGEDCFQSGEGRSQTDITLKGNQQALFKEIIKVNRKVIVVLMNGRPLAIPEIAASAPAILESWFAGSESGGAIADVLFGDYNPSGKLPASFPYYTGQEPLYYNKKNTGRPDSIDIVFWSHYTDSPNEALFSFGHGLSYTTFEYSNLILASTADGLSASFNLSNTGNRLGEEVAQLYIQDVTASITRPIKELKKFKKAALKPGEGVELTFTLTKDDLSFFDNHGKKHFEPGLFNIWIGSNSTNPELFGKLELE